MDARPQTDTLREILRTHREAIRLGGDLSVAAGELSTGKTEFKPQVDLLVEKLGEYGHALSVLAAQYRANDLVRLTLRQNEYAVPVEPAAKSDGQA